MINTDSGQHIILPVDKKEKKMTWQIISGLLAGTWLSVSDRITWWMVVIRQIGQQSRRDWVDLERGGGEGKKLRHSELLATVGSGWWLRAVCVNCKYRNEAAPNTLCEMWPFQKMFPSRRICPSHPQQRVNVRRRRMGERKKNDWVIETNLCCHLLAASCHYMALTAYLPQCNCEKNGD